MNRSDPFRPATWWPALALLIGATLVGLIVAQALLAPTGAELADLGAYFLVAGSLTIVAARAVVHVAGRSRRLSLRRRVQIAAAAGPAIAMVNVLAVAQLMFVSTGHDLRLLVSLIAFGGLVGILVATWSANALADRVEQITSIIGELAQTGGEKSVEEQGTKNEIDALANSVGVLAERLADAERMRRALEEERRNLTAAISHDVRTPLSSIRAMVEALSDGVVHEPTGVRRYYATIGRETDRLSRMVDDLLELAQVDAGILQLAIQDLSIEEIAAEVVDAMQAQASRAAITLELAVEPGLPHVLVDGARIERAIANLVGNAIQYTDPGGRIVVRVEQREGRVIVSNHDNGAGIEPGEQTRIWPRFHRGDRSRARGTRDDSGTGLGLAIAKGFVEAHGGAVGAESTPGVGSVFTIALPIAPTKVRARESAVT